MTRSLRLLFSCLGCFTAVSALADEVRYVDSRGKQHVQRGTVLDYRGSELRIQSAGGRELTIPGDRIVAVDADWLAEHREADQRYARHEFAKAASLYANAFRQEKRRWVQRKLLAQVVMCQQHLGNVAEACRNFARLVDDDADTPYFDTIPLGWKVQQPSPELEALAEQWLVGDSSPVRQLLAASWLLATPSRGSAIRVLDRLAGNEQPPISSLAQSQLWRTRLVTVDADQLARWHQQLHAMPFALRAGPYFILGKGYARVGKPDDALLAWMRLPTMFPTHFSLVQSALLESASILQKREETSAAVRLYRQAIAMGQDTFEGRQAQQRMAELVN